jgi:hypothetical protein
MWDQHLSEIVIQANDLKYEGEKKIEELAKFLEDKLGVSVEAGGGQLRMRFEEQEQPPRRDYLRLVLRKYLHQSDLKGRFRVISGKEGSYMIKQKREAET